MLRVIGNDQNLPRQEQAVASGTVSVGKPAIVNTDGTVSTVSTTAISQVIGSTEVFESAGVESISSAYDSNSQRIVVAYRDTGNSNRGTAIVGTVNANNTITYGSAVVFETTNTEFTGTAFDSSNNKIVISFRDTGDSSKCKAIVGTVDSSDNSISFGSAVTISAAGSEFAAISFDSSANVVVVAYRDTNNSNQGTAAVGTVSGTGISFATPVVFETGATDKPAIAYSADLNRHVILYHDGGNSAYPTAIVAAVSGTTISYGTAVVLQSNAASGPTAIAYDSKAQKFGLFYKAQSESKAAVGTVDASDNSISIAVRSFAFESGAPKQISAAYHEAGNLFVVAYSDDDDGDKGKIALPRISGTDLLDPHGTMPSSGGAGSPVAFEAGQVVEAIGTAYDSVNKKVVITYPDDNNSDYGSSIVYIPPFDDKNLTLENYIGISSGVAFQTGSAAAAGTAVQYEAGDSVYNAVAYDTNVDRVVIVYQDGGNSDYGTAIVGTVDGSDNSISFGTAVVFESAAATRQSIAYEANAQKVVIAYTDGGNSSRGTAIVGTVDSSDNSISFGSPTVFNSAATVPYSTTFDASTNKVVVGFRDSDTKGYAIVGTVSGTDITFGSEAKFNDANTINIMSAYDTNAEKIVFAYVNAGSSSAGTSIVGTVSGTDITFGSAAVFESGTTSHPNIGYDSDSQKVVVSYKDEGDSNKGKAVVGTVSGTSISFGTIVVFNDANTEYTNVVYDTDTDKIVITYQDIGNSNYATAIDGTVSGTDISFGSETVLRAATSSYLGSVYDPDQKRVVTAIRDQGSSSGKAIIFKTNSIAVTRGEVTTGNHALIDTRGALSDNQIGLTPGQSYFVQNDGTIGTSADDPSVFAGTAVAATKLIVKG